MDEREGFITGVRKAACQDVEPSNPRKSLPQKSQKAC